EPRVLGRAPLPELQPPLDRGRVVPSPDGLRDAEGGARLRARARVHGGGGGGGGRLRSPSVAAAGYRSPPRRTSSKTSAREAIRAATSGCLPSRSIRRASAPAACAPSRSLSRRSPTWRHSSIGEDSSSAARRKIAASGFSSRTTADVTTTSTKRASPSRARIAG